MKTYREPCDPARPFLFRRRLDRCSGQSFRSNHSASGRIRLRLYQNSAGNLDVLKRKVQAMAGLR